MPKSPSKIQDLALLFLKLGTTAFGGPAAHIAMMEEEVVKKRKWISKQHFLDLMGATNLIPGPNSTEMTMHCGHERAGRKGMVAAGLCFILPAVIMTMVLAWLYQRYGKLPAVQPFVFGIKPAVIAIIVGAVYRLGKKALKSKTLGLLGLLTLMACLFGIHEIIALFTCGILGLIFFTLKHKTTNNINPLLLAPVLSSESSIKILLIFLKVGALLYGSGYVLFAFLDAELVTTGLLSRQELIDAVAVGQFTPGPVLTTATFIGWQLGGFWGAMAATVGIFLPSFAFVAILNPLIPKLRKSPWISAFLDAVNIAAVAVIVAVCIKMGQESIQDWRSLCIALLSALIVFKAKKLNSAFIVLGSAILGYILLLI